MSSSRARLESVNHLSRTPLAVEAHIEPSLSSAYPHSLPRLAASDIFSLESPPHGAYNPGVETGDADRTAGAETTSPTLIPGKRDPE